MAAPEARTRKRNTTRKSTAKENVAPMVQFCVRIPDDLRHQIRVAAVASRVTVQEFAEDALRAYLKTSKSRR
jgi:predicted HicB family RNase H-like nuclease